MLLLRILLRHVPIALGALGVALALAVGWFSYRYVYRTITEAQALAALRPPLAIELIDAERIRSLDRSFRTLDTLPPIDPASVRDVFNAPAPPAAPKP